MSLYNDFIEELDYEMDEDELLKSDEESGECGLKGRHFGGTTLSSTIDPLHFDAIMQSKRLSINLNQKPDICHLNIAPLNNVPLNNVPLNNVPLNNVPLNNVPLYNAPLNLASFNIATSNNASSNNTPSNDALMNSNNVTLNSEKVLASRTTVPLDLTFMTNSPKPSQLSLQQHSTKGEIWPKGYLSFATDVTNSTCTPLKQESEPKLLQNTLMDLEPLMEPLKHTPPPLNSAPKIEIKGIFGMNTKLNQTSSQSSSTTFSKTSAKRKRKNNKKKGLYTNGLQRNLKVNDTNILKPMCKPVETRNLPSLMSIPTFPPFPPNRSHSLNGQSEGQLHSNKPNVSRPSFSSHKVPFIIEVLANDHVPRRVLINPNFNVDQVKPNANGIPNPALQNRVEDSQKILENRDLRNVVLNKRRPQSTIDPPVLNTEDKKIDTKVEYNDEELQKYLKLIENQKLKREELLRDKELKRQNDLKAGGGADLY